MGNEIEVTELEKVESSNINLVAFDGKSTFVEFKNGTLYSYEGTSKKDFEALRDAESVGRYLNAKIKGKFNYTKMEGYSLKKIEVEKPTPISDLTLPESVDKAIKASMKAKTPNRTSALKLLKAEFLNNSKSKKPLEDVKVLTSYVKKLQKSIDTYLETGHHPKGIAFELGVVSEFLPPQMSDEEVKKFVKSCFNVHLHYENLSVGEIIGKIKKAIGDQTSNTKLIADEVKKFKEMQK